jgi:hypothetical protein
MAETNPQRDQNAGLRADIEARRRQQLTRSQLEIERLEAGEQSAAPKKKKKKKAVPKAEVVGTGRDDSQANFERLSAGLIKKRAIAEAAGNAAGVADLNARLAALKETVQ